MKITTDSFGKEDNFCVGDLVCWTDMTKKRLILPTSLSPDEYNSDIIEHRMVGIISETFLEHVGGRKVAFANVFCLKDEKKYEIALISLKRIDKNETIYCKEGKNDGICYN
jgi:hypothetical protein